MSEYNTGKRGKLSDEDLQSIVKNAVTEAVDFIESDISDTRNKSQRYFEGQVDIGHEPGRSKVVATKVRDTIRTIHPNLMRTFLANPQPVEFIPKRPEQIMSAEQATKYITAEFDRQGGFLKLADVFNDALSKKNGFMKVFWDEKEKVEFKQYTNLSNDEFALLTQDDNVEVVEHDSEAEPIEPQMGPDGQPMTMDPQTGQPLPTENVTHSCTIKVTDPYGELCFETIAPEDFFIDSGATCLEDALVYGHQTEMRVTDLVAMGFKYEDVVDLGSINTDTDTSDEKYEREDYTTNDLMSRDPSMKLVTVSEAYMKVDMEGNGEAEMYKFILGGRSYKLLDHERYTGKSIAVFQCDPRAHLFFGWSIPDILFNEQDASTSMLRGILDNIALTNDPRTEVNDDVVNMDDMLNNEIGNVVRTKAMGNIAPLTVPFIAGETLPAVQYFDQQIENKTGVNQMSSGFNAELLQNQTATAVNAATQTAASQTESIARYLGQGLKDLYMIMLELLHENSPEPVLMRLSGNEFVQMDPRTWDLDMDVQVNVGLGTGKDMEKQAALTGALTIQEKMLAQGSPMVTPDNIFNTLADILNLAGIRNPERYFSKVPPPDPNAPPPEPEQPDPNTLAVLQAEQMKVEQKAQTDAQKNQLEAMKAKAKDDLERDQMNQDLFVDMTKLQAEYGYKANVAELKAAQDAERDATGRAMTQQESEHKRMLAERQQAMAEQQAAQQAAQQQPGPQGPPNGGGQ